jgi:hypothetical protein
MISPGRSRSFSAVGRRQVDLQFGEARIGGRQHQEDQHHQQHVDERDQVDLRALRGGGG